VDQTYKRISNLHQKKKLSISLFGANSLIFFLLSCWNLRPLTYKVKRFFSLVRCMTCNFWQYIFTLNTWWIRQLFAEKSSVMFLPLFYLMTSRFFFFVFFLIHRLQRVVCKLTWILVQPTKSLFRFQIKTKKNKLLTTINWKKIFLEQNSSDAIAFQASQYFFWTICNYSETVCCCAIISNILLLQAYLL